MSDQKNNKEETEPLIRILSWSDIRGKSKPALPEHQRRYALAWHLYRDDSLTEESKEILEKEMDSAQNLFKWDEFQEFKEKLPGFMDHWERLRSLSKRVNASKESDD